MIVCFYMKSNNAGESVNVKVSISLKKKLDGHKLVPSETYASVIERLIKFFDSKK